MTAMPIEHTGRYRCPACPLGFHTLQDKKHHLRESHADTKKARR
jgi:hypothetical protein